MTNTDDGSDLACIRCGYSLRGMAPDANCPECGLPVAISAEQRLLRYSGSTYLATLHSAMIFLLFGTAILVCYQLARLTTGFRNNWLHALVQLPTLIGIWWLATPDTRTVQTPSATFLRKFLRVFVTVSVAEFALALAPASTLQWLPLKLNLLLDTALIMFLYAGDVVVMLYLRVLAGRMARPKLVGFAGQLALATAAVAGLSITTRILWEAFGLRWYHRMVPSYLFPLTSWIAMAVNLASLLLYRSMSRRVKEQLDEVERSGETPSETEPPTNDAIL